MVITMKKINAILLMLIIAISAFTGCEKAPVKTTSNEKDAAITAGNSVMTVGELTGLVESIKLQMTQGLDEAALKEFWETEKDGKKPEEFIKDQAVEQATELVIIAEIAANNGITMTDQEVNAEISKNIPQDQIKQLAEEYKMSVDSFNAVNKKQMIAQKYVSSLDGNPDMQPSDEALKTIFKEKYLKAQHILKMTVDQQTGAPLPQEEKDKKKAEIEELLAKAKQPKQDFQTLMIENTEDTGTQQQPEGYVFTEGVMVEEFYEAAVALKENEISDIVETTYGYHFIKRLPLDVDKEFDENRDAVVSQYKNDKITELLEELKPTIPTVKNDALISGITVK